MPVTAGVLETTTKQQQRIEHCIAKPRISLLRFLGSFLPVLLEYKIFLVGQMEKSHDKVLHQFPASRS